MALALAAGLTLLGIALVSQPAVSQPTVSLASCRTTEAPGLLVLNDGCGLPTVLYAHAASESVARPLRPDLLEVVAQAGFSVVMSDMCGPVNWGSGCAVEELHRLKQRFSPDRPVRVLAMSMGGAALVNYAKAYPKDLRSAVGIVPVTSWDTPWLQLATGGTQPRLAERVPFTYRMIVGVDDQIVGPPALRGPRLSVDPLPGGHELWQRVDPSLVVRALSS